MNTAAQSQSSAHDKEIQDKYVTRLRARLGRPKITMADARDGMLDCFVSTYHAGLKQGLNGILGVEASPDQVAQVATKMFRERLANHGSSFDAPTVDALNRVKDEVDEEFHFHELTAEVSATHDQVCSLLLAKADGLLEHRGDESVVKGSAPRATRVSAAPVPKVTPRVAPPPVRPARPSAAAQPRPTTTPSTPAAATPSASSVTNSLRQALAAYLGEVQANAAHESPDELLAQLDRARSLVTSIAQFQ